VLGVVVGGSESNKSRDGRNPQHKLIALDSFLESNKSRDGRNPQHFKVANDERLKSNKSRDGRNPQQGSTFAPNQ
tara:strand:- start:6795 stop:7019 length:225 start_codon:yes stop_codon:yes gene_type:complete